MLYRKRWGTRVKEWAEGGNHFAGAPSWVVTLPRTEGPQRGDVIREATPPLGGLGTRMLSAPSPHADLVSTCLKILGLVRIRRERA